MDKRGRLKGVILPLRPHQPARQSSQLDVYRIEELPLRGAIALSPSVEQQRDRCHVRISQTLNPKSQILDQRFDSVVSAVR